MKRKYKGVIAALTTPFKGEQIAPDELKQNIFKYNETGLTGYVIAGSTGEGPYLSDEECITLVDTAKKCSSKDKIIIAGTARESVKNTVELTSRAGDAGADSALICTPHYYKSRMTHDALKKYYLSVAEKSKIPIIIYNIPQNTGVSVDPKLIITLVQHPRILGLKDSSGNLTFFEEVYPHFDPESSFLLGAGSLFFPGLIMGADGGILRLACILPELCTQLYEFYKEKKWDKAQKLQQDLVPLNQAVTKDYGMAATKYALDLLGYYGGPCRLPLLGPNPTIKKEIKEKLKKLQASWSLGKDINFNNSGI
ncbi:MAG: dihydrodipicolinate synthase family protein [Acidobacteriota bacterium]